MSDISQKLDFRQSQNLVMTPQLQQAIKILQMNNQELDAFIEEEIAQNPLLEKDDSTDKNAGEDDLAGRDEPEKDAIEDGFEEAWTGNDAPPHESDFDAGTQQAGSGGNMSFDPLDESFENKMTREATLRDHLAEQLHLSFSDPKDHLIGMELIDALDESGYMRHDIGEIASRLGCETARIEKILSKMKLFDPSGIFAADLAECLKIQLEDQKRFTEPMRLLLMNLHLLAAHERKKLQSLCGVDEAGLAKMIAEIKSLNPRPASLFDHLIVQTAIPDIVMKRLPKSMGGGWRVELNSDTLPRVLVNNDYYTEVAQVTKDKKDRKYLDDKLNAANWLVRAMDQRAKTILKVAAEIIEEQQGFFLYGIEFLRPLTLRDIADRVDMHESTISRVTTNKYIGTPRGIFELKYFFTTALGTGQNAHSAEAVKARIKKLIDEEKADSVLSDDRIADILTGEGVDIARRTVAKYREAMHIGSSVQRRREKQGAH